MADNIEFRKYCSLIDKLDTIIFFKITKEISGYCFDIFFRANNNRFLAS